MTRAYGFKLYMRPEVEDHNEQRGSGHMFPRSKRACGAKRDTSSTFDCPSVKTLQPSSSRGDFAKSTQDSSMTSTAVRSTPNLTVPSTQNTAPVLEFRCLYSHDLRRKSKRWQDGFLRFHTFNKRVMVYDVPRNFIGDMHWRRGGTVEDGDELELEKGVLVQVGEAVGSMEQDLTELLEKRRVANESPLAKKATALPTPCPSSGDNATAPFTQLRPKSLNALLGTPRGRYRRAMLPTVSPFEERHQVNKPNYPEEGRSVKRQKLNPPPLNTVFQQSPSFARARPSLPNRRPIPAPTPNPTKPAVRRQEHRQPDIIEVESDDEGPSDPKHGSVQPSLVPTPKRATAHQERPASPLFCSSSPPVSTTNHLPPANPVPSNPQAPIEPSAARGPAESDDSVPVNPLRPAAGKSRKKLMYKDLLPPKRPPTRDEPSNAVPAAKMARDGASNDSPAPPDELSTFHQAQRKRLDARMRRQHQPSDSNPSRISDGDEPLLFTDKADKTVDVIALPIPPRPVTSSPQPPPPPPASGPIASIADNNTKQPSTRPSPTPKPTTSPPRPPITLPTHHPTAHPRRSDSAPDPSTVHPLPLPALAQPINVPHLQTAAPAPDHDPPVPFPTEQHPHPIHRPAAALNTKAPLRKCASLPLPLPPPPTARTEMTSLTKGMGKESVRVMKVVGPGNGDGKGKRATGGGRDGDGDGDQDTGPWSREAADLFGWRPPTAASASASAAEQVDT